MKAHVKNTLIKAISLGCVLLFAGCAQLANQTQPITTQTERPQTESPLPGSSASAEQAAAFYAYKSAYVADSTNTVGLLSSLSYGAALQKTELLTQKEPYGIIATYDFTSFNSIPEDYRQAWEQNAAILFALIGNVEEIYFNSGANTFSIAYRAEFETEFGQDMRLFAQDEEAFAAFLKKLTSESGPGSSAEPASQSPALQGAPSSTKIGEGDLMADYTIDLLPGYTAKTNYFGSTFRYNDLYAGGVELRTYYPDMPYGQLLNNHTEILRDWSEIEVAFRNPGAWENGLEKIIVAHFNSDDYDDPLSGQTYDHTTYYLIFKEKIEAVNYMGEKITYQRCYVLDFATTYYDEKGPFMQLFSDEEILGIAQSFALKGDVPYQPAVGFDKMREMAESLLEEALYGGKTSQMREMYEAMGKPVSITEEDLIGAGFTVFAQAGKRVWEYTFEKGGIRARIQFDMDTGKRIGFSWGKVAT